MEKLLEEAVEKVIPVIEAEFPRVQHIEGRVENMAQFEVRDYLAGPSKVHEAFLDFLMKFQTCCWHHPGKSEDCRDMRRQGTCPAHVDFPEENRFWATREETYGRLTTGGYVSRVNITGNGFMVLMKTRLWDAIETGKISPVDERIIELLCLEVHRAVHQAMPAESMVEVLPQKRA